MPQLPVFPLFPVLTIQCYVVSGANTAVLQLARVALSVEVCFVKRDISWSPNDDLLLAHSTFVFMRGGFV